MLVLAALHTTSTDRNSAAQLAQGNVAMDRLFFISRLEPYMITFSSFIACNESEFVVQSPKCNLLSDNGERQQCDLSKHNKCLGKAETAG